MAEINASIKCLHFNTLRTDREDEPTVIKALSCVERGQLFELAKIIKSFIDNSWTLQHPLNAGIKTRPRDNVQIGMVNYVKFSDELDDNCWYLVQLTNFVDGVISNGIYYSLTGVMHVTISNSIDAALARLKSQPKKKIGKIVFLHWEKTYRFTLYTININILKFMIQSLA